MMNTDLITADEILQQIDQTPVPASEGQPSLVQVNPYVGIAAAPFAPEAAAILMSPVATDDIEVRPDGLIYLPEIKYRRILNRAFGPGAWSLLPIEITVSPQDNMLYYKGALFVYGRFVSEAIGEQQYFPENDRMSYATAAESAKSNCLMRCCKDLGIASELWDPSFIRKWIAENAVEVWCQNIGKGAGSGSKKKMWRKRTSPTIEMWPWREDGGFEPVRVERPRFDRNDRADAAPAPSYTNGNGSYDAARADVAEAPARTPSAAPVGVDRAPAIITFKQAKRFRAIARDNGYSDADIEKLLARHGFANSEEITRNEYDRLCVSLENPALLEEIRGGAAAKPAPAKAPEKTAARPDLPNEPQPGHDADEEFLRELPF
jgi:hypothetical protein